MRTNYLTSGSSDLIFSTSNGGTLTEGFRLLSNGYFGLGTASPATLLDMTGNLTLENTSNTPHAGTVLHFTSLNNTYPGPIIKSDLQTAGTNVFNNLVLSSYWNGYKNEITLSNGNVGMGTATPTARLTLASNNAANPNTGTEIDYAGEKIAFRNESSGGNFDIGTIKMVQPNGYYLDRGDMVFSTANGGIGGMGERMRIDATGNVGIGTTLTSAYKLAVNGSVHAKQVNVDLTGWGDYVFNKDHSLRSLAEVKAYIDKNHHLPEMPSAATVEKEGINLGEMNKLLVKKVEELTLYLLDQQKTMAELQKQLKDQQKEIEQLKK
jgi:hypothetical protein